MKSRLPLLSLVLLACSGESPSTSSSGEPATSALPATPAAAAASAAPHAKEEAAEPLPSDKFGSGAKAFAEVREALLKNYYATGVSEDDLYRAAAAGMLQKFDPQMTKYNQLLTPHEVAEIRNDLKGEIVGIGVRIEFDAKSGYADVLGTIPGSPSEKAGLVSGDKIVSVNGRLYKGKQFIDVVSDIRGKAGDPITITVLHADKLTNVRIVRERISFDAAESFVMPEKVGYVRIPSFTSKTPETVKGQLDALEKAGVHALVVDLRHSPGGSFEHAIETAELFVPNGSPIVTLKKRDKKDETRVAKGTPILGTVPVAVLVDGETASGAEFLAGALQESRHAKLIGAKTHGKWSVQSLDDLSNGWAFKYTVGVFTTPSGKTYEGVGITPDLEISMPEDGFMRAMSTKAEERVNVDAQLRTARELVR